MDYFQRKFLYKNEFMLQANDTRGFNGSVNIPERCDFQSQFNLFNITF